MDYLNTSTGEMLTLSVTDPASGCDVTRDVLQVMYDDNVSVDDDLQWSMDGETSDYWQAAARDYQTALDALHEAKQNAYRRGDDAIRLYDDLIYDTAAMGWEFNDWAGYMLATVRESGLLDD